MSVSVSKDYIFEGSNCFRIRIMLSILSGKPIMIHKIRVREEEPGLHESEVSFLKLIVKSTNGSTFIIDETGTQITFKPGLHESEVSFLKLIVKSTNGSTFIIDETGTQITFKPGLLHGGPIEHDCGLQRSISYFLQPLIILAPFCKVPIEATLTGITNDQLDVSIDALRQSTIPLVSKLISVWEKTDIELTVVSRGMPPNGGGKVFFKCPIRNTIKPINLLKPGKIKRIRGIALATRVAPNIANRMIDKAKGLLLKFIPDVYIHSDHLKGKNSGNSPGFGLSLVAETTEGIHYTGEAYSNPSGSDKGPSLPEDVAQEAVFCLFEEIYRGGCVSSINQSIVCLYMALGQPDVSKVEFGPLSPFTVQLLKHMRQILQIAFKLEVKDKSEEDERDEDLRKGSEKIMATCVGIGFSNLSKTII